MNRNLKNLAVLSFIPFAAALAQDQGEDKPAAPESPVTIEAIDSDMFAVKGIDPVEASPNGGSFRIDGRNIPKFKTDLYHAKKIVILFKGESTPGRECPSFNLGSGDYAYSGNEDLPNLFKLEAFPKKGDLKQQMASVADKQCLIAKGTDPCKIKFIDNGLNSMCALNRGLENLKFWK